MEFNDASQIVQRIAGLWPTTAEPQLAEILRLLQRPGFAYPLTAAAVSDVYLANSKFFLMSDLSERAYRAPGGDNSAEAQAARNKSEREQWEADRRHPEEWRQQFRNQSDADRMADQSEFIASLPEPLKAKYLTRIEAGALPINFMVYVAQKRGWIQLEPI